MPVFETRRKSLSSSIQHGGCRKGPLAEHLGRMGKSSNERSRSQTARGLPLGQESALPLCPVNLVMCLQVVHYGPDITVTY